jgi:hypothetical protein
MRRSWLFLFLALAVPSLHAAPATDMPLAAILRHARGIWSLEPVGTLNRWVVIHNLKGADENTVLHVEVLARPQGDPAWSVRRLQPHMAISMSALRGSVRKPLQRGYIYPESYEQGFAEWKKLEAAGTAPVCRTSVDRCLSGEL